MGAPLKTAPAIVFSCYDVAFQSISVLRQSPVHFFSGSKPKQPVGNVICYCNFPPINWSSWLQEEKGLAFHQVRVLLRTSWIKVLWASLSPLLFPWLFPRWNLRCVTPSSLPCPTKVNHECEDQRQAWRPALRTRSNWYELRWIEHANLRI